MADPTRPRKTWDLALSIVLLVLLVGTTVVCVASGGLLAFTSDSCGVAVCDYDLIGNAIMVGLIGPPVIFLLAAITTVLLLVRRRLAFWVPLVGGVLMIGLIVACFVLASSAVTPAA